MKGSGCFLSLSLIVYRSIHLYRVWLGEHCALAPTPVTHLAPAWPCTALWPSSFKSVSRLWRVNKWIHLHKGECRDGDAWNWKGQSRFAARQLWYKREIRTVVLVGGYCCWSLRAWSQYWTAANHREHRDMFVFIDITCKMLLAGSGTFCGQSLRAV